MSSLDWACASARLGLYAGLIFLFGVTVFPVIFAPGPLGKTIAGRFQAWALAAAIVTLLSVASSLPLLAGSITDDWAGMLDGGTLSALLTTPDIGLTWLARLALAALLLIWLYLFPARPAGSALIATLLLASFALTGHAAMQEGVVGWLHAFNHGVHVISASLWLGSLIPLLACLRALQPTRRRGRSRRKDFDENDVVSQRAQAVAALRRFSSLGHGAVACVLVTGIVNAWLILGRWPLDWTSPYQALLAAKIALVALMAGTAVINRYVFTPRIGTHEGRALARIARGTLVEIGLGAGVLALVAVFGLLEPV